MITDAALQAAAKEASFAGRQKILCKRFSTKSRISRRKYALFGLLPLSTVLPGGGCGGMRAACGVNAVAARRGILTQGN